MDHCSRTYDWIVDLLYEMQAGASDKVSRATRLHHDLGMDGDDALAFLEAIDNRWGVDWSGFDFGRHFLGEAEVSSPVAWLARRLIPAKRQKVPITVGHLIAVVEAKRWSDPNETAV